MQQRSKVTDTTVHFNNLTLSPTDSARNLGVIFDSNLHYKKQISSVCKSSFFHIRQLRKIRPSLDRNSAVVLANSLVHSKIDYCNSLLNGLPTSSILVYNVFKTLLPELSVAPQSSDHILLIC